jgi:hypothetical protein
MTLERGFRRIVNVLSLTVLGCGVLFLLLLAGAGAGQLRLDKQREAQLVAEGCPADSQTGSHAPAGAVLDVGLNRWRVTLAERDYTSTLVVTAQRRLTHAEVFEAVQAAPGGSWVGLSRKYPVPGIEVVDCILESLEISRSQESAPSSRLINWWMNQPVLFLPMVWVLLLPKSVTSQPWLIVTIALLSGLALTGAVAALPWGTFYLIRWIAHGFTDGPEEGKR